MKYTANLEQRRQALRLANQLRGSPSRSAVRSSVRLRFRTCGQRTTGSTQQVATVLKTALLFRVLKQSIITRVLCPRHAYRAQH